MCFQIQDYIGWFLYHPTFLEMNEPLYLIKVSLCLVTYTTRNEPSEEYSIMFKIQHLLATRKVV